MMKFVLLFTILVLAVNAVPHPSPIDFNDNRRFPGREPERAGSTIVFPDRSGPRVPPPVDTGVRTAEFDPIPAPSCVEGLDLCDAEPHYPMEAATAAMDNFDEGLQDMFHEPLDIDGRIIPNKHASRVCESIVEMSYPQVGRNADDEFMWIINNIIINDTVKYAQRVDSERCLRDGKNTCNRLIVDGLPEGYTADCKQKYSYKKLLALTSKGSRVIDSFKVPSSCVCYLVNRDPAFRLRPSVPGQELPAKLTVS